MTMTESISVLRVPGTRAGTTVVGAVPVKFGVNSTVHKLTRYNTLISLMESFLAAG